MTGFVLEGGCLGSVIPGPPRCPAGSCSQVAVLSPCLPAEPSGVVLSGTRPAQAPLHSQPWLSWRPLRAG